MPASGGRWDSFCIACWVALSAMLGRHAPVVFGDLLAVWAVYVGGGVVAPRGQD